MSFLHALLTALRILNSSISRSLQLRLPLSFTLPPARPCRWDQGPTQHLSLTGPLSFGEWSYQQYIPGIPAALSLQEISSLPWGPGLVDMRPLVFVFRASRLVGWPAADPCIMSPIPALPLNLLVGSLSIPSWSFMHFLWFISSEELLLLLRNYPVKNKVHNSGHQCPLFSSNWN